MVAPREPPGLVPFYYADPGGAVTRSEATANASSGFGVISDLRDDLLHHAERRQPLVGKRVDPTDGESAPPFRATLRAGALERTQWT